MLQRLSKLFHFKTRAEGDRFSPFLSLEQHKIDFITPKTLNVTLILFSSHFPVYFSALTQKSSGKMISTHTKKDADKDSGAD